MSGLLDGIRVLEVAVLFNGDIVGQHLGDLGADVIKIESPGRGDYLRDMTDRDRRRTVEPRQRRDSAGGVGHHDHRRNSQRLGLRDRARHRRLGARQRDVLLGLDELVRH